MKVLHELDASNFLQRISPVLSQNEAVNSLLLGVCTSLANAKERPALDPVLVHLEENGKTSAAAIQTPPFNLILSPASSVELSHLAHFLFGLKCVLPGVVGPGSTARKFSEEWCKLTGQTFSLGMGQKLYQLHRVIPVNVPGNLKVCDLNDALLIGQWLKEFGDECLPVKERKPLEEWTAYGNRGIEKQNAYAWEVDGKLVCMTHVGRPTQNGISVSAVYTPKEFRKKGYASGLVAAVSQRMLDSGKRFCVLYTDLSNPTSNKIYQNVGYQEVTESSLYLFE